MVFGTKNGKKAHDASVKKSQPARSTAAPQPEPAPKPAAPAPQPEPAVMEENMVGKGTVVEGNLTAQNNLRVEGTVKGDVTTKQQLVVGDAASVEGNITATDAEISGHVKGTVTCSGLLTIRATCVIDGDVITKNLNVEAGSTFNGRFQVGSSGSNPAESVFDLDEKPQSQD